MGDPIKTIKEVTPGCWDYSSPSNSSYSVLTQQQQLPHMLLSASPTGSSGGQKPALHSFCSICWYRSCYPLPLEKKPVGCIRLAGHDWIILLSFWENAHGCLLERDKLHLQILHIDVILCRNFAKHSWPACNLKKKNIKVSKDRERKPGCKGINRSWYFSYVTDFSLFSVV